jgi:hypothetical protein
VHTVKVLQNRLSAKYAGALLAAAMINALPQAQAQTPNALVPDTPTAVNGTEVVCTGVGFDARQDPRWSAYPLKVEIAGRGGQYLGEVQVVVIKDGRNVVEVDCGGPWVLFKLPAGRYEVRATNQGRTVSSSAYVPASGQGRIILRFPETGGALEPAAENGRVNGHAGLAAFAN